MKKILFLAFTLALAVTQAQVSREYPAGFDKWKVIQNARQKGIPEADMDGYVRAAYARYLQKGNEHSEREYREKLTVVNMNKRQVAQTVLSTQCQNSDFSMLNYSNWTGDVSSSCGVGTQYPVPVWLGTGINGTNGSPVHMNTDPCNGATISTDRHTIMSMPITALTNNNAQAFTNGYDPSCCNNNTGMYDLPMTPQNGVNSIRLGSAYPNYTCEKLVYQMTVNNTNTQFTYRFAVVINDGGHGVGEQPAFLFAMRDSVGNLLTGNANCVSYNIDASGAINDTTYTKNSASNPCFNSGGSSTYYRKWHTVTVDLTSYINHTVYAEFQTLDCAYSGHFCYAYISANCGALAANVSGFCGGSGSVVMSGPPGFASYQWYGPNSQTPISGATASTYTASGAINGDVFSVDCITLQGCTTKLNVTVSASNIVATGATIPSCLGGANGSASVSVLGGTQFSYSWNTGASGTSITNQPPGTYSVTVHDVSTAHCPDTTLVLTITPVNPPLQTTTDTMCGTQTTLHAPTTGPYTWYDNNNQLISGSTAQNYTVTNGAGGQHFTVTYHDPNTGCLDSLRTTLSQINISFVPLSSPPCNGGNNGSITVTGSSGNTFPNYDWTMTGTVTGSGTNVAMPPNVIQANNLPNGNYVISVNPTGNATCVYSMTVNLQQGSIPPPVLDTLKGCALDHLSVPTTTVSGSTHNWYSSGVSLGSSYPYITSGVTTGAVYTDTIRNSFGCISVYKAYLKEKSFKVSITSPEKIHCHNDSTGKLKVTATQELNGPLGTNYVFNWNYPNPYPDPAPITAGVGVPQSSQVQNLHAGTYTCVVTSGNCVATATYALTNPALLPYDSLFAYFCPKDSIVWLFTEPGHPKYTWVHNGVDVPNYNNDSIAVTPQTVGDYWVWYTAGGCRDTANKLFTFPSFHAFTPTQSVNIFTPNNDGKNDFFFPFYDAKVSQYQIDKQMAEYNIVIFNRWGKKIYESNEYSAPWDGKVGGEDQHDGTYYYMLRYKSNCSTKADIVEKHGFVQLLR